MQCFLTTAIGYVSGTTFVGVFKRTYSGSRPELPDTIAGLRLGAPPGLEGRVAPLWLRSRVRYISNRMYRFATTNVPRVERLYIQSPQNEKRTPSCTWRLGKAEVNANGVLDDTVPPPARAVPGLIPFTLKLVKPGSKPKRGLTSLFTLA